MSQELDELELEAEPGEKAGGGGGGKQSHIFSIRGVPPLLRYTFWASAPKPSM